MKDSEPEPDVVVVQGETRHYLDRHPGAGNLALVVEISEAMLERDRTLKQRLYARAGISTYWIVNLIERQLEVYTNPINRTEEPTYQQRQVYGLNRSSWIIIGGIEGEPLAVQELFP
jgi:Uma2 family endonuclease